MSEGTEKQYVAALDACRMNQQSALMNHKTKQLRALLDHERDLLRDMAEQVGERAVVA